MDTSGLRLVRSPDRGAEVEAFAARYGERVGLAGMAESLNRRAKAGRVPAAAAVWGFRWDARDQASRRWWPQGVTTSGDADDSGRVLGRTWVVTSAYAKPAGSREAGSRLSFVDVSDAGEIRYRNVLLVEARYDKSGALVVRPVKVHAGGIVWHAGLVHVAATARGLRSFRVDDIVDCPDGDPLGWGYRFVLPLRFTYDAPTEPGVEPMRHSFLSLDRSRTPYRLLAGEYGHGDMTTRLLHHAVDAGDPVEGPAPGIERMQGAVVVDGIYYVSTSAGRLRRGSLWVGTPGALRRHRSVLPVGPEDLAYQPASDRLWSLSEYPGRRYVFAMDRGSFS